MRVYSGISLGGWISASLRLMDVVHKMACKSGS